MKKDLPQNIVENVAIAIVMESATPEAKLWKVYLINLKDDALETVLVSSKGYGEKDGEKIKTSILRHSIESVPAKSFAEIELIDEQVFGLTNEYWLSFYISGQIYDKKFIFVPESIVDTNMTRVPLVNKPGVMIG
jgi:transcriptional regulator of heat shock response